MKSLPFHEFRGSPLSLYIHVPFCLRKCHYCAFHSVKGGPDDFAVWLSDIREQAELLRASAAGTPGGRVSLDTAYIGGGTPTALGESEWRELARDFAENFIFPSAAEFSVEANPETLRDFHIGIWEDMGVTRVSLGVQSLDDGELAFLGRRHSARGALAAVRKLKGRFGVSADLMFGLSGQSLRSFNNSVRALLDEGVEHLSLYQLTVEPGTKFSESRPLLPDGYGFYRFAQWLLPRLGLRQYEIASFARPGHECRHNQAYWYQRNVAALGAASSGYINGLRYTQTPAPGSYRTERIVTERLDREAAGAEAAILALRTSRGIDTGSFSGKYGAKLMDRVISVLGEVPEDCVNFADGSVNLTARGMRVANEIWSRLL